MRTAKKYAPGVYRGAMKRYNVYQPAVKQLASDVMYLKGLINSEPKNHTYSANNNVDYNGVVLSTTDIPQGDSSITRDGDRILPRYYGLHLSCNRTSTATTAHQQVRIIVFRWWGESPNTVGVAPTVSNILTSSAVGTQNAARSFLTNDITGPRGDRQRRIEVLRNYYKTLSADQSQIDIVENIEMNGKSKQRKEHIEFYSSATNPPTSGGIFVLIISDNSLAEVAYHVTSKLTFYDN